MKIKKCEFIKSAAGFDGFIVSDLPQIVVSGKSNVGKSSFINFLTNNSKMAKTSNTPGRTRLVNYFHINDFFLVDLPGYGFAKGGSKREVASWGKLMEDYFEQCEQIKHVIMLVDIRHLPSKEDILFVKFLYSYRIPFSVVATKSDKISKTAIHKHLQDISNALKIGFDNIFAISSYRKVGLEKVFNLIETILATPDPVEEVYIDEDDEDYDENLENNANENQDDYDNEEIPEYRGELEINQ